MPQAMTSIFSCVQETVVCGGIISCSPVTTRVQLVEGTSRTRITINVNQAVVLSQYGTRFQDAFPPGVNKPGYIPPVVNRWLMNSIPLS